MQKTKTRQIKDINAADIKAAELQKQIEEVTARWKRAVADYQNLEKRIAEEKQNWVKFAAKNFIVGLLPVVDDLEKANAYLKDAGLGLALSKLDTVLKQAGVEKFGTVGRVFDINTMEAVSTEEAAEDKRVVRQVCAGYNMFGSVIRPAKVVVGKMVQKPNDN